MKRGLATLLAVTVASAACSGGNVVSSVGSGAKSFAEETANQKDPTKDPRGNEPTAAVPASTSPSTAGTGILVGGKTAKPPPPAPTTSGANLGAGAGPSTGSTEEGASAPTTAGATDDPKKISARHVLIQWMGSDRAGKSVLRTKEQALVLAQDVLKRAKAGQDVGRLAVEYSDEPNAGARGGSLGRFTRGQMVPAFDAVAFKLKVGEVSGIVESPFGYHIIQRTE